MVKDPNQEKKIAEEKNEEALIEKNGRAELTEQKELLEKKESSLSEEENKKARHEIESADLDDTSLRHATSQASDISSLDDQEKIKSLLQIAKQKGVVFAVNVAKKADPFILDKFHDILEKEGYYKSFLK